MLMEKLFKDQYDDEEVLLVFRKHPVVMRKGLILFMVALLLGVVPSLFIPEFVWFYGGLGVGLILGLLLMFPSWVYWYFSVNIMTDQRFIQIVQKGFFKKSFADINIKQIQSVNYHVMGVQETLLGFGTIVMQTYLGDSVIHEIHHPEKIAKEISIIIRDNSPELTEDEQDAVKVSHERQ